MISLYYHSADNDGFACSWVAHRIKSDGNLTLTGLGKELRDGHVILYPWDYGQRIITPLKHSISIIADLNLPEELFREIIAQSVKVFIVDHHESGKKLYQKLMQEPEVTVKYDSSKSACVLLWELLIKDPVPTFLNYISDHDLFEFKLPYSKIIRNTFQSLGKNNDDLGSWDRMYERQIPESLIEMGSIIQKVKDQMIERALANAHPISIPTGEEDGKEIFVGVQAVCCSVPQLTNELGHALAEKASSSIGCVYWCNELGKWHYSLRSLFGVHVHEIAKYNGGGGHSQAAGFIIDRLLIL